MLDTTDIIKGCIANDHRCQKTLYEQFRAYALKIVFRYIYTYDKAVDVVNDGFVKLFRHFGEFRLCENGDNEKVLMGWLKKIMINTAIDALRKNKMAMETGEIPDHIWDVTDEAYNADHQLSYKDLVMLIKQLPPAYRTVFNLYIIDGYTHEEIGKMLGMSTGTSKSTLSRARAMLQKTLKNAEEKAWRK